MEEKKLSVFDIVNICVLGAALVLCIISNLIFSSHDGKLPFMVILMAIATIVALISAIGYMLFRYSKKVSFLYKIYMYSFVAISFFYVVDAMTNGTGSTFRSFVSVLLPVLSAVLATAKDYGKVKTYIVAGLLLLAQIVLAVSILGEGIPAFPFIVQLVFIIEACIMVLGKYRDKDARGTI